MSSASDIFDLAIVGSGPAGSSAALAAVRGGLHTLILEKALVPRYKTCGGGLVLRARKMVPVDLSGAIERECYRAELHLQDADLHFATERSEPMVSMTMREDFDFRLLAAARSEGAELVDGCEVTALSPDTDRVALHTPGRTFQARFVIGADGALSRTAKLSGWPESRLLNPALECEIPVSARDLERFAPTARFDFGVTAGGYGWVFPKRRHLSVGVMTIGIPGSPSLHSVLRSYLESLALEPSGPLRTHGFVIPVRPRKDTFVRNRVALTGDAAGLADPLTGEGISYAILSGRLAAAAVSSGKFDEGLVLRNYHESLREQILPELRLSLVLSNILYRRPRTRTLLFRLYGQVFCEAVTDILTGSSSYRQKLSNPRNYLRLLASSFL